MHEEEFREGQSITSKLEKTIDKTDRKYLGDALLVLALLLVTVFAYVGTHNNPSVLFAGALGLTFFVAANLVLNR